MHRILPGLGIGGRYLADFSDTVAPALGLAQALATAACSFLPPARISTTDLGPRGICLLRSMTLPSPILTPTAGLPPLRMVQRRIYSPVFQIGRGVNSSLPHKGSSAAEFDRLSRCVVSCSASAFSFPFRLRPSWWCPSPRPTAGSAAPRA